MSLRVINQCTAQISAALTEALESVQVELDSIPHGSTYPKSLDVTKGFIQAVAEAVIEISKAAKAELEK